ncbi:leucyl aminopeptidase family protein [Nocardioides sp. JQ2195]|uniref:leucyl aminopeptidase family protein n=1 Tax=Nocardioides sp. JQ2195 TaxID=2592334 RepID=UPI00143E33C8|nr:leucyl aminopeptidase family protein [Nocardioides sp. JQ2195]QIX27680.1 leucyl aminopeptidase family protein [Nocardioides sp. JQ2195]
MQPPTFSLVEAPLDPGGSVVVALPVLEGAGDDDSSLTLGPGSAEFLAEHDLDLFAVLDHHGATGKPGEVVTHPLVGGDNAGAVVLVGLGSGSTADLRAAGAGLARAVKDRDEVTTTITALADDEGLRAFVVGLTLGSFEFHWRKGGAKAHPVRRVVLAGGEEQQPVLDKAVAVAAAGWRARYLASVPSNAKNPAWLVEQAREVADATGLKLTVWDETKLEAEGFGGILAVGAASDTPPRMIRIDYTPRRGIKRAAGHVALVGKGITFDTGGLSIKPGEAMVNMKRDMTGGAVVIATMGALAAVDCPIKVTALVPTAENAIGGSAYRPGDVIRHFGGRTTEVTNTDAEGRLVMADALAYAVAKVKPDALVDVATLTGAMKVALGLRTGGLFANDDALAAAIDESGTTSGERLWRMPLAEEYEEKLSSKVADGDNGAGNPGAITAALFLQHFTGGLPWAHLDVASVGDAPTDHHEWTVGPTGFGARTLITWLERRDPLDGITKERR